MANRKKNRRRKTLSRLLITLAILIALAAVGVKLLRQRVTAAYGAKSDSDVQQAAVTLGSISATISGTGTLAAQEVTEVQLPTGVSVRSLRVEAGDTVAAGDVLAYLDLTSVLTAMNELQAELDALDSDIAEAARDTVSTVMKSTVAGRVKAVYCESGQSVLTAMYEHGALLTLSLDGYMAVDIPAKGLAAGRSVTVSLPGGTYPGTVDQVQGDRATVLVTDNQPRLGDDAVITDEDGRELGRGQLYIHQPLNITGYAGTVSRLAVAENAQVTNGRVLLYLTDTAFTANYDALLQQREQAAKDLNELIGLYSVGVVTAPIAGKVETIADAPEAQEGGEAADEWTLATVRPQEKMIVTASIDESYILSVELGQTTSVTISSISSDPFTGEVTSIEKTGASASGVTGYAVEVTLDKADKMLPRMSATVAIRIEGVDDALLLPEDAVTRTRTSAYVYTAVNAATGELEGMAEVKTGLTGGGYIEIVEGLREGDTVYYSKKQANDFSSFMGGFGGNNRYGGNTGGNTGGSNRPGGNTGGSGNTGSRTGRSGRNGG